jgi:hypothetical protein
MASSCWVHGTLGGARGGREEAELGIGMFPWEVVWREGENWQELVDARKLAVKDSEGDADGRLQGSSEGDYYDLSSSPTSLSLGYPPFCQT